MAKQLVKKSGKAVSSGKTTRETRSVKRNGKKSADVEVVSVTPKQGSRLVEPKTVKTKTKRITSSKASADTEERRLARNAALREWRKANRDKVNEYNRAWHAAKKAARQKDESAPKAIEVDLHGSKPSAVGGEKSES